MLTDCWLLLNGPTVVNVGLYSIGQPVANRSHFTQRCHECPYKNNNPGGLVAEYYLFNGWNHQVAYPGLYPQELMIHPAAFPGVSEGLQRHTPPPKLSASTPWYAIMGSTYLSRDRWPMGKIQTNSEWLIGWLRTVNWLVNWWWISCLLSGEWEWQWCSVDVNDQL